ncbi:MAG: hypothetical protein ACR2GY_05550 [Phycisphaerales bacterium]
MFKSVTDFALKLSDLAESEGKLLKHHTIRVVTGSAIVFAAVLAGLGAVGFLAAAAIIALIPVTGAAWAALIVATALGLVALILGFVARHTLAGK